MSVKDFKRNIIRFVNKILTLVAIASLSFVLIFNFSSIIKGSTLGQTNFEIETNRQNRELRNNLKTEVAFWESQVIKTSKSRDVYLQTAILHWRIGNLDLARIYLRNALDLDPNYEAGLKLEELLKS